MQNTPLLRLLFSLLIATLALAFAIVAATSEPRLPRTFAPGDEIGSAENALVLEEGDFLPEPGEITARDVLDRFYERQDRIAAIAAEISTTKRTVADLSVLFWIQAVVGLGALLISGWIWALRPKDLACRLFVLSGVSTLTFTLSAATYTTRDLALPASLFRTLTALNSFGASA